jgi:plastocyanin
MNILGRRVPMMGIAALAALMVLAVLLPAMSSTPTREIALVARGMAFYAEDAPQTMNPTLEFKAGERVRVVLRNDDRGMTHDFAIPAVGVGVDPITWNERGEVVFDVPTTPGNYEYVCRPHLLMMRGAILVY